jgi:DNA-binding NarL/FixJ family response regulator
VSSKLVFVAPDYFYRLLLSQYRLEPWTVLTYENLDDALDGYSYGDSDVFVFFADQFEQHGLVSSVSFLRARHPQANLVVVADSQQPKIVVAQSGAVNRLSAGQHLQVADVPALEQAITDLFSNDLSRIKPKVTNRQLKALWAVALGLENSQIAEREQISIGAVETLLSRAMTRIGVSEKAGARARVVAAQRYLGLLNLDVHEEPRLEG